MPDRVRLRLSAAQQEELEYTRDHDPRAYVRERCGALLKVADGQSALQVAQHGLLKVRDPDSVYEWVRRYKAEGLPGLLIRAGRGRHRVFSPTESNGGAGRT
jgi:transposase